MCRERSREEGLEERRKWKRGQATRRGTRKNIGGTDEKGKIMLGKEE